MTLTTEQVEASRQFVGAAERTVRLWAMPAAYDEIVDRIERAESEEDATAYELELDQLVGDIRHKAESVVGLARWYEGLAAVRKTEAQRMAQSAAVFEQRAERLKTYVQRTMEQLGIERIDTDRFSLAIRSNPPSVVVLDASAVPHEFERTKITIDVDKRAILAHVKATGEIPVGCEIRHGQRLEVR